jgi:hypothetical protein
MIHLAVFSVLIGAVFGLRFKVMVLLPLTVIGCLATAIVGFALRQPTATLAISLALFAASLQFGYIFGSLTRMTMAAVRAPRVDTARASLSNAR